MKKNFILILLAVLGITTANAQTYTNEPASVTWSMDDIEDLGKHTCSPESAFSITQVNTGDLELTGTGTSLVSYTVNYGATKNDTIHIPFVKLMPSGSTKSIEWSMKPTTGLTFTPTKITCYISRFGTDAQSTFKLTAKAGSNSELIGTYTAPRANKLQKDDKYGTSSDYIEGGKVEINLTAAQQKKFTTSDYFILSAVVGVGDTKEGGYAQVKIEGTVSGTQVNLPRYTLTTAVNPEDGGTISVTPVADTYEQGTTVNVTIQKKFGYKYINTTDASGSVISTSNKFTYTVNADSKLTANFEALPYVSKQLYNFIIPDDGTLRDAITAANAESGTNRFYIFVRKGTYVTPDDSTVVLDCTAKNGKTYPGVSTYLRRSNVSIIGEDRDACILTNNITKDTYTGDYGPACPYEGLHNSMVLSVQSKTTDTYIQDVTIKSSMGDSKGRNSAFEDYGDRTICYNIGMYGFQDTYYSGGGRYYFEGGILRGATDYLCGKGDCYFNNVNLMVCNSGAKIAVPSSYKTYGYVFRDCTINGEKSGIDGNFTLGRPWGQGTPTARFINTRMNVKPSTLGWDEMSGGYPRQYAEYNSIDSKGNVIDLSGRKKEFGNTGDKHANNPILTKDEADALTIQTVMGGTDNWDPTLYCAQLSAPTDVAVTESTMTWSDDKYAMGWALLLDGEIIAFTTEPTYNLITTGNYSVRAINQMGGLSPVSASVSYTGSPVAINTVTVQDQAGDNCYNLAGQRVSKATKGIIVLKGRKYLK